jgi:hypothetical protein
LWLVLAGAERSVVASLQLAKKTEAVTNIAISLILVKSKFLHLEISFLNDPSDDQFGKKISSAFVQWFSALLSRAICRSRTSSAKRAQLVRSSSAQLPKEGDKRVTVLSKKERIQ